MRSGAIFLVLALGWAGAALAEPVNSFWSSRDLEIAPDAAGSKVRVGVWDSGVDLALFEGRVATDSEGRPLVRGYDSFKQRQDTPMAVLPPDLLRRQDEMNRDLLASDDIDSGKETAAAKAFNAKIEDMSKAELAKFDDEFGRWSGYTHGTAVADIALAGNSRAEMVVARMEWWHGSPPVPCWSSELADREAESIRDLMKFLSQSGVRVVNMSWGRFETSYLRNLEQCAANMPESDRKSLARYTVEKIRSELQAGMAASPEILFVGAAGNAGSSLEAANPATRFERPNFILVGAVDSSGALADYSNKGSEVAIYANGDRVPARLPGGMQSFPTGTSMATPNVANAAAKMLTVNPALTGAEIKQLILQTADTNGTGQRLLHTRNAVEAARRTAGGH